MADEDAEAALVALLSRLSDADDQVIADRAIDLYLHRLSDQDRLAAFARLIRLMLIDDSAEAEHTRADGIIPWRRRQG